MSSISGVSGSSNAWAAVSAQRAQHQAKMFAKVDTDSSGGVDQTELSSMLSDVASKTGASLGDSQELFTKMDSNADGSLSSDELDKGMKDLMPPPSTMDFAQSRGMGGSNGSQDDLFSKVDTDSDGAVSQDELQVLTDKIKSESGQDVSQDFSLLDADGSGSLSQAEFDAGRPQRGEDADLAGTDEFVQRIHHLVIGRIMVGPVRLVEVDIVGLQPLQRSLDRRTQHRRRNGRATPHLAPAAAGHLGSQHHPVAAPFGDPSADDLLGPPHGFGGNRVHGIHLGRVQKIHPRPQRPVDLGMPFGLGVLAAPRHGAKAKGGHHQPC